jgi:uncharacterized protein (DUF3084 family)
MLQQKELVVQERDVHIQQLSIQLREKDERLEQKEAQLQQKDDIIQQNNADICALQREVQRLQVRDNNDKFHKEFTTYSNNIIIS